MEFIPAKESRFYISFFYRYTQFLFSIRFKNVYVNQQYFPDKHAKTVYYLNHNYWWDGLIPLYLNEKFFHQHARAIMEDKQMRQYRFFSRIGAFSINPENPKSAIKTLRYAVEFLNRDDACLFIYPEGKIMPVSTQLAEFQQGLSWIYKKTEEVDFVPISLVIDSSKANKPDLHIEIGAKSEFDKTLNRSELTELFKFSLEQQLNNQIQNIYQVNS